MAEVLGGSGALNAAPGTISVYALYGSERVFSPVGTDATIIAELVVGGGQWTSLSCEHNEDGSVLAITFKPTDGVRGLMNPGPGTLTITINAGDPQVPPVPVVVYVDDDPLRQKR